MWRGGRDSNVFFASDENLAIPATSAEVHAAPSESRVVTSGQEGSSEAESCKTVSSVSEREEVAARLSDLLSSWRETGDARRLRGALIRLLGLIEPGE